jgi:hypothetical protein
MRKLVIQGFSSYALQGSDDHPDTFCWWYGDKQMYVVLISVHCFDENIGMILRPGLKKFFEIALNPIVENALSVFGWSYKVKVTGKDTVAHSAIHGHCYSIREL